MELLPELWFEILRHCTYITRSSLAPLHLCDTEVSKFGTLTEEELELYWRVTRGGTIMKEEAYNLIKRVVGNPHQPNRLDPTTALRRCMYSGATPKRLLF